MEVKFSGSARLSSILWRYLRCLPREVTRELKMYSRLCLRMYSFDAIRKNLANLFYESSHSLLKLAMLLMCSLWISRHRKNSAWS